jgi:antitoxin component YwqK of YwqJK toxin-antitoxin module
MNKLYVALLLTIGGFGVALAQNTPSRTDTTKSCSGKLMFVVDMDAQGRTHGKRLSFYRNGQVAEQEVFSHGRLSGQCVYFFDTGDTSMTLEYKNGALHGLAIAYYPNRKKMFKLPYHGGKLNGETAFFDTTGHPFTGLFKEYCYRLGQERVFEASCVDGKPEGNVSVYSEANCTLLQQLPHKNGLPNGRALDYTTTQPSVSLYEFGKYVKEDDSLYAHNIAVYNQYLLADSSHYHFYYLRALAYLRERDKKSAIQDLNKVARLEPTFYKAYYNRGVLLAEETPLSAMQDFRKCLLLKPDFYLAQHNLAYLYFLQKDYKNAIASFKKVIKQQPDYMPSIHHLCLIYEILKDKKQADYYWKMAAKVEESAGN